MTSQPIIEKQTDQIGEKISQKFFDFLYNFQLSNNNNDNNNNINIKNENPSDSNKMQIDNENISNSQNYIYRVQANLNKQKYQTSLTVDFNHVIQYDSQFEFSQYILQQFFRFEPFLKNYIKELYKILYNDYIKDKNNFFVKFINIPEKINIRKLKLIQLN